MLSVSTTSDVMCPAAVMAFWGREIYGNAIQRTAVTATPSGIDKCHFTRLTIFGSHGSREVPSDHIHVYYLILYIQFILIAKDINTISFICRTVSIISLFCTNQFFLLLDQRSCELLSCAGKACSCSQNYFHIMNI